MKNTTKKKIGIRCANRSGEASAWVVLIAAGLIILYIIGSAVDNNRKNTCVYSGCNNTTQNGSLYCYYHSPYRNNSSKFKPSTKSTGTASSSKTTKAPTVTVKSYSAKKSSSYSTSNDPYDVYDYDDPEDFYYDHYDDFDGYEDAEDYFDTYR